MSSTKPRQSPSENSVINLASLLNLPDRLFVEASYKVVLGRPVDADGMANYVAKVQNGVDKVQILVELATSAEGRQRSQDLAGLNEAIAKYASESSSLWARLVRQFRRNSPKQAATQVRVLENKVLLFENEFQRQASELFELRCLVLQLLFEQGKAEISRYSSLTLESAQLAQASSPPSASLASTFAALKISIANSRGG